MTAPIQPFGDECAIVLDKWLYDVCSEEMQFPSHRRQQYDLYMDRVRLVMKERNFVAGTFVYPSRNGLREVAVLETLLDCLQYEERKKLEKVRQLDNSIESALRLLEDKTMGASPYLQRQRGSVSGAAQKDGYQKLITVDEANYAFHLQLAERYIEELQKKGEGASSAQDATKREYDALVAEKGQLEADLQSFQEKEKACQAQLEAAQEEEEREDTLLQEAQARWAALEAESSTWMNQGEDESGDQQNNKALVAERRAQLIDIGHQVSDTKHAMLNEEQVHRGRVRQAKQKVSEWEDITAKLRTTHTQKRGQVKSIATILQHTADRLAKTSNGSSLTEQLSRLNHLLYVRTTEYMAGTGNEKGNNNNNTNEENHLDGIRPLQPSSILSRRESEAIPSGETTPSRYGANLSTSVTPIRGGSAEGIGGNSPGSPAHRSRYDIVTHLEKWERALREERQRLRQVVKANHAVTGQSVDSLNAHRRIQYNQLKDIIFRA
ncbi:hypothetical protein ADEAN_001047600 [Angomonas deanei]|uniref:Uncharacterized protein n=1 Tax=Angomonas deanei TaxID=59799 RepID=A0A7G2CT08_9TRYP|nr:hypothetical protein ADEAN_001047600 [Angomonas deanei]